MRNTEPWRSVWLCAVALVAALGIGGCGSSAQGQDANDAGAKTWAELQAVYAYDHSLPLEANITQTVNAGAYTTEKMTLRAVDGTSIPAILHRPNIEGAVPCILLLHGYGGDKESYSIPVAILVAPKGVAVMAIDARLHGERAETTTAMWGTDLAKSRHAMVNTVIDNCRALDYLDTRDDIDCGRYMLLGISMGGMFGAVLGPVDDRIKSGMLIVAGGRLDLMYANSQHETMVEMRAAGISAEMVAEAMADCEPVSFVGHFAPRPLLFINGTEDQVVPRENAEFLHGAAGEPKEIVWYEGGHIPPLLEVMGLLLGFIDEQLLN